MIKKLQTDFGRKGIKKLKYLVCLALTVFLTTISFAKNKTQEINEFAKASLEILGKFNQTNFSFMDQCQLNNYFVICGETSSDFSKLNCKNEADCDSATLIINKVLHNYFFALEKLSNNQRITYQTTNLSSELKKVKIYGEQLNSEKINAYEKISAKIATAITKRYVRKKIKLFITEDTDCVIKTLQTYDTLLSVILARKYNALVSSQKECLDYLLSDSTLTNNQKADLQFKFYEYFQLVENRKREIVKYGKGVKQISNGYLKLANTLKSKEPKELRGELYEYTTTLKEIIEEFNHLKK